MEINYINLHCRPAMKPSGKSFNGLAGIKRIIACDIVNLVMSDTTYEFIQQDLT